MAKLSMDKEEATYYANAARNYKGQTIEILDKRDISRIFTLVNISNINCQGENDEIQKCKCIGTLKDKNGNTKTYSVKKIVELFEKKNLQQNL